MIQETAAISLHVHRPADRVDDQAIFMVLTGDFPDFLDAEAIRLWVGILAQIEFCNQCFRERAVAPFGQDCLTRVNLDAGREAIRLLEFLVDADIACGDPDDTVA